jgi:uncharacterized protein YkwD
MGTEAVAFEPPVLWASSSESPQPLIEAGLDPLELAALHRCGAGDAALAAAARTIVARRASGGSLADLDELAFAQRAAGEPHPWARAWAATAASLEEGAVIPRLSAWLAQAAPEGIRRCGVASATRGSGERTLVVLVADALADLGPLPTRARTGEWLTVEARMRVATRGGEVFVAGPTGVPRQLPSWFDGTTLRARFAPAETGRMTVQVVAELTSGSRPVLEATIFADANPPAAERPVPAPGEDVGVCPRATPPGDEECHLARMLATARASVGLAPLAPDVTLAALARAHAAQMATTRRLAHDAGDGSPTDRLRSAGIGAREIAENVVHAPTIALAHRALWASPSHRANMLAVRMEREGVGVVRDELGEAWAVEIEAR